MFSLRCILACILASSGAMFALGQDVQYSPQGEQIPGPRCQSLPEWNGGRPRTCQPQELSFWLADVRHWREERKFRIGFDPALYESPALKWAQSSFIQPQMMVHDRYFFDPVTQRYTVDRYLADLEARYGGIDSVLIWHTYPNIGIDSRNQFDLFLDLPGGIPAVKAMISDFHRHGVKVLFPVMVWDQGTHADPDLWRHLSEQLAAVGADGVNGDTLDGVPQVLMNNSVKLGHPLALEPEAGLAADEMINYNPLSWGYWNYTFVPTISRYKWLEPRHMVHISNRWAHDHLDDLQSAFFSGVGFESWENIWGIWNQMTPRDAEALRRTAAIDRAFAANLVSPGWEPHTPTRNYGIFASSWPSDKDTLWTLVNRNAFDIHGEQMRVPHHTGAHYYDLWHGVEIAPRLEGDGAWLSFDMESRGYGAILETTHGATELTPDVQRLLHSMKALSQTPLESLSNHWQTLAQSLVPIDATRPAPDRGNTPPGMVLIPEGDFSFRVNGIEIEGQDDEGVDVQYPWEGSARRFHEHNMHVHPYWIDTYPVTNGDFKRFLDATGYQPADAHNFLRDWQGRSYPEGLEKNPVTWVSLEDARAYAKWAGKRLPHEWEWQYAAQGTDGRRFPWGNFEGPATPPPTTQVMAQQLNAPISGMAASPTPAPVKGARRRARGGTQMTNQATGGPPVGSAALSTTRPTQTTTCPDCPVVIAGSTPIPDHGRDAATASDVDAHPRGASPFGVMDLVGNVWQWTDEYLDEHTRYAILRGGSHYQPQGSRWYFPQGYELTQHGKYLLMAPSLDRSATVGFRCVVDTVSSASATPPGHP